MSKLINQNFIQAQPFNRFKFYLCSTLDDSIKGINKKDIPLYGENNYRKYCPSYPINNFLVIEYPSVININSINISTGDTGWAVPYQSQGIIVYDKDANAILNNNDDLYKLNNYIINKTTNKIVIKLKNAVYNDRWGNHFIRELSISYDTGKMYFINRQIDNNIRSIVNGVEMSFPDNVDYNTFINNSTDINMIDILKDKTKVEYITIKN